MAQRLDRIERVLAELIGVDALRFDTGSAIIEAMRYWRGEAMKWRSRS